MLQQGFAGQRRATMRMMMTKRVIVITHQRGLDVDRMTGVNPSKKRRQVRPRFTMLNKTLWKSKNESGESESGMRQRQIAGESSFRMRCSSSLLSVLLRRLRLVGSKKQQHRTGRKEQPAKTGDIRGRQFEQQKRVKVISSLE